MFWYQWYALMYKLLQDFCNKDLQVRLMKGQQFLLLSLALPIVLKWILNKVNALLAKKFLHHKLIPVEVSKRVFSSRLSSWPKNFVEM